MGFGARPGAAVVLLVAVLGVEGCKPEELVGVQGALTVAPGGVDFGLVALGQLREERVILRNTSRLPVTVSRLSSSVASVSVSDSGGFTLAPAQERELVLRFAPVVEGAQPGELVAETSLYGLEKLQRITLQGVGVRSYVDIRPRELDFGRVELNTEKTLTVDVANPTAVDAVFDFTLGGDSVASFSAAEAATSLRLGPGERRRLSFTFRPQRLGLAGAIATFTRCASCVPEQVGLRGEGTAGLLDISPPRLDFDRVALGARAERRVTLLNRGNDVVLFQRAWTESELGFYSVVNGPPQTSLRQGQSMEVAVAFEPTTDGQHAGLLKLEVSTGGAAARTYAVELSGLGGTSCVTILPRTLDFGVVPEGTRLEREATAHNTCEQDVTLSDLAVHTSLGGVFSLATPDTTVVVPSQGEVPLKVAFVPRVGSAGSQGQLTATVQEAGTTTTEAVELKGNTRPFGPCDYRVEPPTLPFGRVQVGSTVALGVAITNVGAGDCFLTHMGLAAGSDATFSADALPAGVLAPGEKRQLTVRFSPLAEGASKATVEGSVNHPTQGTFSVPVSGEGVQDCFTLEPGTLDFLSLKLGCAESQRQVLAVNRCATAVTLSGATLDAATTNEMRLFAGPPLPYPLAPGATVPFTLAYVPTDEGDDSAAFRVSTVEHGTLTTGVLGRGLDSPTHSDRFVQEGQEKVDVLFVVDNSASMREEQQNLGRNFAAFMSATQGATVDYHIGVTTTGLYPAEDPTKVCNGGVNGAEAGRLFPADGTSPRIITPATPDAERVFTFNTNVGTCPHKEYGLEAAYRALSEPLVSSPDDLLTPLLNDGNAGFLRTDARLALVFVSDEEDGSNDPLAFYEAFFRNLKANDPNKLSISAIVGPLDNSCSTAPSPGARYIALAQSTRGIVENICTSDWANSLRKLSEEMFGLKMSFPLTQLPADPTRIQVLVNGVPVPHGWTYDPLRNSVEFERGSAPPRGALVDVAYPLGC